MSKVSDEPHPRHDSRQDAAYATRDGWKPRRYRCPRCEATVILYVEVLEVRCSCGAHMRPSEETPPPAKERGKVALNARW